MKRVILSLCFSFFNLFAQSSETNVLDIFHDNLSQKVENISLFTDDVLAKSLFYTSKINFLHSEKEINPTSVDALFQNEKYLNETKKSFVRFSTYYFQDSRSQNEAKVKLTARLALTKTTQTSYFFLQNFQNNASDTLENDIQKNSQSTEFGVSFFQKIKQNLETKYSLGLHSTNLFTRARISYKYELAEWTIAPEQNFEYSLKDEFAENTTIYFDKELIKKVLLRFMAKRSTQTGDSGMGYNSSASVFWTPQSKTGLNLSVGLSGNTDNQEGEEHYSGINAYETRVVFRQNIWRKWFFYELSPAVSFEHQYDFHPTYSFYIRFDIFFGKAY